MLFLSLALLGLVSASTTTPPISCAGAGSKFSIYTTRVGLDYIPALNIPYQGSINTPIYFNNSNPAQPFQVGTNGQSPAVFELRGDCSLYYKNQRINTYNIRVGDLLVYGSWTLNPIATNVPAPPVVDYYTSDRANITVLSFSYDASAGSLSIVKAGDIQNLLPAVLRGTVFVGPGLSTRARASGINPGKLQTFKSVDTTINDVLGGKAFYLSRYVYAGQQFTFPLGVNGSLIVIGEQQLLTLNKQSYLLYNGLIGQIPKNGGIGIYASTIQSNYEPLVVSLRDTGGVTARLSTYTLGDVFVNGDINGATGSGLNAPIQQTSTNSVASILDLGVSFSL